MLAARRPQPRRCMTSRSVVAYGRCTERVSQFSFAAVVGNCREPRPAEHVAVGVLLHGIIAQTRSAHEQDGPVVRCVCVRPYSSPWSLLLLLLGCRDAHLHCHIPGTLCCYICRFYSVLQGVLGAAAAWAAVVGIARHAGRHGDQCGTVLCATRCERVICPTRAPLLAAWLEQVPPGLFESFRFPKTALSSTRARPSHSGRRAWWGSWAEGEREERGRV